MKAEMKRGDWLFLGSFVLLKIIIHLPVLTRYGFHHDELYFVACGRHPAFGYVDHPPLIPWIARLADTLFPQSLFGLRIFALLAGAVAVFLMGLLTRRLGGGRFAQAASCLAMIIAPAFLREDNMLCIPAFELPLWLAGFYLLARIIQEKNSKLWLWLGVVTGIELLTKHSMLFFGFGLVVALLLTEERRQFKSPWLYAGGAIASLIFLPNLIWQMVNGWPTVLFLRNLSSGELSGISPMQFVAGQFLYLHPIAAPIWLCGLIFLFSPRGKPYRVLGWMFVSIFLLLLLIRSKIYYLAPAYPPLLAAGGLMLEELIRRRNWSWLRPVALGALVLGGLLLAPIILPVLPIETLEKYVTKATFGAFQNVYELTGDLHGMYGWRARTAIVAEVYRSLSPEEQKRTIILAGWYGPAAAIDYFGKPYGLPGAVSNHMSYYLWGLPAGPIDTVISIYVPRRTLQELFQEVLIAADVNLTEPVLPRERRFVVAVCREPKEDLHQAWARARNYGF
ncbi:MAG TPA: glycosyltransferase family 39 protein [Acidobacteriota bacterium]|nr:glycosyltransferase family 39 protein [Acidobacteriota bacterium]